MEFIEIIKAIILGIIEGITEWLPVSSTGHMILVDEFLQLNMSPAFKEMFCSYTIRCNHGGSSFILEKDFSFFI